MSTMRIRVTVTAEDIGNGERWSGCECPVALAMTRAGLRGVVVEEAVLGFYCGEPGQRRRQFVESPAIVETFIARFDLCSPVEPFEFELPLEEATNHGE